MTLIMAEQPNPSPFSPEVADLKNVAKRMVLWQESIDAALAFILANVEGSTEKGPPPVMKHVRGTWMPVTEAHFTTSVVSEAGSYQEKAYLRSVAHTPRRNVAIDIGANIGLWARSMAKDFQVVHCFEPQSQARACLVRNAPFNNVVVYPWALGATEGEAVLTVNRLAIGGAMIPITDKTKASMSEKYPSHEEKARVATLDSLDLAPDYIKIDVQGFEADVLRGAEQTIRKHKPTIICEAGGQVDTLSGVDPTVALRVLESYGYRIAERIGKDAVLVPTNA